MSTLIAAIMSSRPVRWLIGAVVALLGIVGIVVAARRDAAQDARREAENDALNEYVETRRRIDAVEPLGADAARERLRDRQSRGDL